MNKYIKVIFFIATSILIGCTSQQNIVQNDITYSYTDAQEYELGTNKSLEEQLAAVTENALTKITLSPGNHTVQNSLIIPSNIILNFEPGATIQLLSSTVVTINADIEGYQHSIFSGDGQVIIVNVMQRILPQWWGAKGDGITDDSVAIYNALRAVPNDGEVEGTGGTVYFKAGNYMVSRGFEVTPRSVIEGDGPQVTKFLIVSNCTNTTFSETAGAMFFLNGTISIDGEQPMRNVTFRNLTLSGADYNNPAGEQSGILFRQALYCHIESSEIVSFAVHGIIFDHQSGQESNGFITVEDSIIRDCNYHNIVIENSNKLFIKNNIIRTGSASGIVFNGGYSTDIQIIGNQFSECGESAIYCVESAGTNVIVNNNLFQGCGEYEPNDGTIQVVGGEQWQIINNYFDLSFGHGIYVKGSLNQISHNFISRTNRTGIVLETGNNNVLNGNVIQNASLETDNTYYGILVKSLKTNIIGNTVIFDTSLGTNQQKYGIYLSSGSDSSFVESNAFKDSGKTADIHYEPNNIIWGDNI
jgi:hypothetical protein